MKHKGIVILGLFLFLLIVPLSDKTSEVSEDINSTPKLSPEYTKNDGTNDVLLDVGGGKATSGHTVDGIDIETSSIENTGTVAAVFCAFKNTFPQMTGTHFEFVITSGGITYKFIWDFKTQRCQNWDRTHVSNAL